MVVLLYVVYDILILLLKKTGKESQYIVSRPELGSDPSFGSDRELGRDTFTTSTYHKQIHHFSINYLLYLHLTECKKYKWKVSMNEEMFGFLR